ncbi:MAG: hypothetical protein AABW73_03720 [Nanoarchaeota archaeon]
MFKISLRVWILIIFLLVALVAVHPSLTPGVVIKSVEKNSSAYTSGLRSGMIINSLNGLEVSSLDDYSKIINDLSSPVEKKYVINTDSGEFIILSDSTPNITVGNKPRTRLKTGLDLQGGARALVRPQGVLTDNDLNDLIDVTSNRLNVFGITDISIRPVTDLSGQKFMLIEVAGATPADIRDLVAKQGKFEAKIGNQTVFTGGTDDIADVCRFDATCSGVRSCSPQADSTYFCQFSFVVYLSQEAAQRHADITSKLKLNTTAIGGRYLEKQLDLLVDGIVTDSLLISEGLKGQVTTEISVQGSGVGVTQEEAFNDATASMNKLQTIMITGSLPYKLEIVKLDTLSPTLGKEFTKNILILGLLVFAIVSIIIFVKYRKIKITLSVILTMFSEAFITLGVAAFLGWNLDAPSIAGIIAGMGTGVNDQIIILAESTSSDTQRSIKDKIKSALFVIFAAFSTILVAMIPLFWTGAGLLKGFAFTTIISISIGIFITRPAFADILRNIQSK